MGQWPPQGRRPALHLPPNAGSIAQPDDHRGAHGHEDDLRRPVRTWLRSGHHRADDHRHAARLRRAQGLGELLGNDVSRAQRHRAVPCRPRGGARRTGMFVIPPARGTAPTCRTARRPSSRAAARPSSAPKDRWAASRARREGPRHHPELYPIDGEPVIDKPGKGAFFATDLELILRTRRIRTLFVCGVTTEVCVNTTVREANDRGFECVVLEGPRRLLLPEFQDYALRMIKAQGAIFGWSRTPATPSPPSGPDERRGHRVGGPLARVDGLRGVVHAVFLRRSTSSRRSGRWWWSTSWRTATRRPRCSSHAPGRRIGAWRWRRRRRPGRAARRQRAARRTRRQVWRPPPRGGDAASASPFIAGTIDDDALTADCRSARRGARRRRPGPHLAPARPR